MKTYVLISFVCLSFLIDSCREKTSPTSASNFDRKAMLQNMAENIILPSLEQATQSIDRLEVAVDAFVAAPSTSTFQSLQAQWIQAYENWQAISLFQQVGPGEDAALFLTVNIYPTDTNAIHQNIETGNYDLSALLASDRAVRGFPAIDFLINAREVNQTIDLYTTDAQAKQRAQYLKDVVADLDKRISSTAQSWESSYKDIFINTDGTDDGSSLSQLYNSWLQVYENRIRTAKIGLPIGRPTGGGTPRPHLLEARYKGDISIRLAKRALQAFKDIYLGGTGLGFDDYLQTINRRGRDGKAIDAAIQAQIIEAQEKLNQLTPPLYIAVTNQTDGVNALFDVMQKLVGLIKVDMRAALELNIQFQDTDGD